MAKVKFSLTDMLNSNSKKNEDISDDVNETTGAGIDLTADSDGDKNLDISSLADSQILDKLVLEIKFYSQQTALNMIEVGKRLIEAKKEVPHGQWEGWLNEKVDISYRSATRLMQVARECSNLPTLASLSSSKIFALLDLPSDDRESFIQQPHELASGEIKTVDEMTTRQLQETIKAQKEAERRAEEAEQELAKELEETKKLEEALSVLEDDNIVLRRENKELADRPIDIAVQEVIKEVIPDDYNLLKQQNELLNNKVATLTQAASNESLILAESTISAAKKIKNLLETQVSMAERSRMQELKITSDKKTEVTERIRILTLLIKTVDKEVFAVLGGNVFDG